MTECFRLDVSTKTYPNVWAIIDAADAPLLEGRKWHAAKRQNGFYVVGKKGRKAVYLHRLLTGAPSGAEVDHIDGNPLNNRRTNLRLCTHQENMAASAIRRFGPRPAPRPPRQARPHVVRMRLADGSIREYVYPPRSVKKKNERGLEL